MFKKVASEALGLSDIGSVIGPEDYDKVDADDYILHEDGEKIFFLIKSKADEYCFTNKALIHVDGTSAMSKKRTLRRYNYHMHDISNVTLETAGTVDLDVEIKFTLGNVKYSIDVHKKFLTELKDLYKALLEISDIIHSNEKALTYGKESVHLASQTLGQTRTEEGDIVEQFKGVNKAAFIWLINMEEKYKTKDFGHVFEKYINN